MRFLDGDPRLHLRVAQIAAQWNQFAGLRFEFNNAPGAPIRVSFTPGPSWSYIGTDALDPSIGPDEPTLNFGWLTPATPNEEVQRVVLHEFGHALGLIHEHQSPQAQIPWNRDAVYAYYSGPPNFWTPAEVEANLIQRYAVEHTNASDFDPTSIMLYPIPPEFTDGTFQISWNRTLSKLDQTHIAKIYPNQP